MYCRTSANHSRARSEDSRTPPDVALLYAQLASFNTYSVGNLPETFVPVEVAALAGTVPILYVVGSDDILYPHTVFAASRRYCPTRNS